MLRLHVAVKAPFHTKSVTDGAENPFAMVFGPPALRYVAILDPLPAVVTKNTGLSVPSETHGCSERLFAVGAEVL